LQAAIGCGGINGGDIVKAPEYLGILI